jgi:hypothetical protein
VDEVNPNSQPPRKKVLRAADVIPPFDRAEPLPPHGEAIPSYDLAEHILAEQRRMAGRRRRAPGEAPGDQPQDGRPTTSSSGCCHPPSAFPEATSPDLLELQQLVAQIVARDIEQLCRRPDRPRCAVPA